MSSKRNSPHYGWCIKAQEDELSIRAVLKEGAPSTACFLAQQMTEKYLKALLSFHNTNPRKVHDLLELETMLLTVEPKIREFHDSLVVLNRYYIETRYPGDYPAFSKSESQIAFEEAQKIQEFVMSRIEK